MDFVDGIELIYGVLIVRHAELDQIREKIIAQVHPTKLCGKIEVDAHNGSFKMLIRNIVT